MANFATPSMKQGSAGVNEIQPTHRQYAIKAGDLGVDETYLLRKYLTPVAKLWTALFSVVVTDMDGGTPGLTFSLGIGDADGVIDDIIIADSDAAQAGGEDRADAAVPLVIDVGGRYLIFEITTVAGTAADGTMDIYSGLSRNMAVFGGLLK